MSLRHQPRPDQRDPLRGRTDRDRSIRSRSTRTCRPSPTRRKSRRWTRSISPASSIPSESAKLMTEAGFTKNGDGLWEKDGATIDATIQGFEGIHSDIVPILVEMLRNGGFDASINFGTDAYQNMADGKARPLHVRPRRQPARTRTRRSSSSTAATAHRSARQPATTGSRATRTPSTTPSSMRWRRCRRTIRSSRSSRSRRWRSTGATRSTFRSSSGSTASPTTSTTGPTGRRRTISPWARTAPSGPRPACSW